MMYNWNIQVEAFPSCCKSYLLHKFLNDTYYYWDENRRLTKEEIKAAIRKELTDNIDAEYEETVWIAAVSVAQTYAEEVLEEFGFKRFNMAVNPTSDDGEVHFYSYLYINENYEDEDE